MIHDMLCLYVIYLFLSFVFLLIVALILPFVCHMLHVVVFSGIGIDIDS